jgi:hypothetical protein
MNLTTITTICASVLTALIIKFCDFLTNNFSKKVKEKNNDIKSAAENSALAVKKVSELDNRLIIIESKQKEIIEIQEKQSRGIQKGLKKSLYNDYKKYKRMGYCPIDEKELYESTYHSYHDLGNNGMMDKKYSFVMSLPDCLEKKK